MKSPLVVSLDPHSYPIHILPNGLNDPTPWTTLLAGKKVVLITNEVVGPLYENTLLNTIKPLCQNVHSIRLADGETHKNADTWLFLQGELLKLRCDRHTILLALGGGVIGDLVGFVAATYMRGISFIQVPTTLLAQVDSSVGGKTGINHPLGKNMIGAFHQPKMVVSDLSTLNTLSERDYKSGLAEVIKYGLIRDRKFLEWLMEHSSELNDRNPIILQEAIWTSCRHKSEVVKLDEFETLDIRALLNLGHTFGHAIEAGTGYGSWMHGEAVAVGMLMAAALSHQRNWLSEQELHALHHFWENLNLPQKGPNLGADQYLSLMAGDKKNQGGQIRLILLKTLGEAIVSSDTPTALLRNLLNPETSNYIYP